MLNNPFNLSEVIDLNGMQCYLITKEVLDELIFLKESSRRKNTARKLMPKSEVLELLGCSESTLYRRMRKKDCKIRRGSVNGTFITQSVLDELNSS
ncbi:hypothetical protein R3X28_05125 [Maribacter sp. TH_r10]|uniref:helix-turn-helix transcriptional regulator n=1 Tax=Maribacter sp. TH_r10 TaxID=3082086 RepID=UPI002954723C|nr:hypothetical protein [Maribacter sp. TH_r10]MDV7138245.1 hypothetical protein [Maribacter sp. TH_r10]